MQGIEREPSVITRAVETFSLTKKYQFVKDGICDTKVAEVVLHIKYADSTYRVCNHMGQNHFTFVDNAQNWSMQLAVSELIVDAIKFAREKLNLQ